MSGPFFRDEVPETLRDIEWKMPYDMCLVAPQDDSIQHGFKEFAPAREIAFGKGFNSFQARHHFRKEELDLIKGKSKA
jgi:hypothetical protein